MEADRTRLLDQQIKRTNLDWKNGEILQKMLWKDVSFLIWSAELMLFQLCIRFVFYSIFSQFIRAEIVFLLSQQETKTINKYLIYGAKLR